LLNPGSLVSIVYRFIDTESTDRSRYEISRLTARKWFLPKKNIEKPLVRYIYDGAAAKNYFG